MNDGVIPLDLCPGFMWSTTILMRVFGVLWRAADNDEWY